MHLSKISTVVIALLISLLAISLVLFPEEALKASVKGLNIWWKIVFPSLLPFFIVSELLIGFGVVKFIGVLLEPIMRPIFRVPGVGGFVWAMGMASGNPAGAKLAVRLRKEHLISRLEGERLVAFTSCANPLFIFGAVSAGFFQNGSLGVLFGLTHYISNFFVGLLMRFYGGGERVKEDREAFPLKKAFEEMHHTRLMEKRPFGKMLGDAVISSIQTLLMIGGFIIFFSVLNRLLSILQITHFFGTVAGLFFSFLQLPIDLSLPFISGLFEMTIGIQMVSETGNLLLMKKAVVVSFLLAFGGFSIQAQVGSILAQSDIRFRPFFFARFMQGVFSAILTVLLWKPVYVDRLSMGESLSTPVFMFFTNGRYTDMLDVYMKIGPIITILSLMIYILLYARRNFSGDNW